MLCDRYLALLQDMYASVGLSVGRDLNGSSVAVNGTSLPVTLTVASVRAYQFMDMKDAPVQVRSRIGITIAHE